MEHLKKALRFFLGFPVTIISFLFILKIIFESRATILNSITHINLVVFVFGIFTYSAFFLFKSIAWIEILRKRGQNFHTREMLYDYAISDIKRYLPVGIMSFVSRVTLMENMVSKKETLKAIGIETFLLISSALIMSIPAIIYFLIHTNFVSQFALFLIIFFAAIGVAALFIYFRNYFPIIKKYIDSFLLFCLSWSFFAIASFLVLVSISPIYPENTLFIWSFFILSWLIGYLSFITPMGIGVREVVATGSLSFFMPLAVASVASILSRIAMILGEIYYVLGILILFKVKRSNKLLKIGITKLLLTLSVLTYIVYFSYFTFLRHLTFVSGRFDLGNMSQTLWNTINGNFLILTNPDGIEPISRLGIHADFILVLLSPFYLLWSDPRVLLLIQTIIIACGAFFVYGISQNLLKNEKISLLLGISYLLNFWVQEQTIFDFHAISLATTFLLASFYYLFKKKYLFFSIFILLSLLTKENLFLISFLFGIYFIFIEKKIKMGIILSTLSLLIFYYLVTILIPSSRGSAHFASMYYSYLGDSLTGVLKNLIIHPNLLWGQIFRLETLDYINKTLIPTGYLSILSPIYLIFALPDFMINILSSNANLRSQDYHYGAVIIPFIYIATIFSIKFLKNKYGTRSLNIIFYYLVGITIFTVYNFSPLPGMKQADNSPYYNLNYKLINSYLSIIPKNASVSASNNIAAHLSNREKIYVVPRGMELADYVVFFKESPQFTSQINFLKYDLVVAAENFAIYKKASNF